MDCPEVENLGHLQEGQYYTIHIGTNYAKEVIPLFYFPLCMFLFH